VEMFQQSIRNQSVKNIEKTEKSDKFVNLETIKEKFDESEMLMMMKKIPLTKNKRKNYHRK